MAVFAAILLLFSIPTQAQLSSKYSYSYVGTNINALNATPTILQASGTVGNNAVFASQAIGFTFKFNCVDYTTIGISANGFIWFGSGSCSATQYTPLSSTAGETGTVDGIISAFGTNIVPHTSGTRTLSTKLTGVAPNRVFTIEWRKCCMTGATTNPVDVQIKLFETSNNVEIRLFDNAYLISGTTAVGQVGMRSTLADFVNRSTAGVNLCTTTAGAVNTATCSIVPTTACNFAYSGSGAITFVYSFTGGCCTTPATQSSAASISNITFTSADLSWTPGSGTGGDIVFLKQGSAITTDPSNNTTYTPNTAFGSGSQIGTTGAFAVYSGLAGVTSISNLMPGTTYYYSIYTFDAAGPCYKSPTVTTGSFTTNSCSFPLTQASLVSTVCIGYNSMNLQFTRGSGSRVIVLARAGSAVNADPAYNTVYTANAAFGAGSQIGVGNFVVYDGNDAGIVTIPITGLTSGVTYYFSVYEYDGPPNCYNNAPPATAMGTTRAPGIYSSSTTTQNTTNVAPGTLAADVVKLTVVISGGEDIAATINSISFTTTGSTNTATDITNARIFYTGNSNTFSNATQYGQTFTTFGANTAVDNFALKAGNNYFWIAYDVKATATLGDVLDATVTSINITDNNGTVNQIPTITAPVGSRLIAPPAGIVYCSGVIPEACCSGTGCNFSCSQGETLLSIALSGSTIQSFAGWPCNSTCGDDKNSYTDMFNSNIYELNQGASSTMSINFDTWFSMDMWWVLWVDWGQDGVFTNAAPERFPASGSIDQWTSQTITVPASVSAGRHRARLWVQEFSYKPTDPCRITHGPLTTSIGYIVDFNIYVPDGSLPDLDPIVIAGATSCPTPVPVVTTPINYTLGDVPSQLTATGSNLLWYASPTGGVGSAVAPTPTTSVTGTQTYYVSQNVGGCESPRTQIAVNVYPPALPLPPTATVTQPTCEVAYGIVDFSGLPTPGLWTINPNGISSSGSTYTLSPVAPGSYDYTITNSIGCISSSSVNVIVNAIPLVPSTPIVGTVTQPTLGVPTGSVVLSGLPANGWTINPGGIVGAAGVTSVTITGLAPGTYTFTVTSSDGCTSDATVTITIDLPLPIELLDFYAVCMLDHVSIIWSTASETNNDYFTLEKSQDALNWAFVAMIDGAGNSQSVAHYFYIDNETSVDPTYYRLIQTDFDGSVAYFNLISLAPCGELAADLIISPNPSDGLIEIMYTGDIVFVRSLEIFDALGDKVYMTDTFQPKIDVSHLPNGIYSLFLKGETKVFVRKFLISK